MKTDVMIDLETLDVTPTATILTIGAVKFDPFGLGTTPSLIILIGTHKSRITDIGDAS